MSSMPLQDIEIDDDQLFFCDEYLWLLTCDLFKILLLIYTFFDYFSFKKSNSLTNYNQNQSNKQIKVNVKVKTEPSLLKGSCS